MYILTIIMLMFILPILAVLTELLIFHSNVGVVLLIGKWFVFWAVGVRLFSAGLRQVIRPQFTVEEIFGIRDNQQFIIVQELGFANISVGTLGIISILNVNWTLPAAIVGCLFIGLAGVRHVLRKERNLLENSAMFSNLIIFVVLLIYIIWDLVI
jgi:hypothetical protein